MDRLIWALPFLLATGLVLLYSQRRINAPRLVYTPLPSYDIPDLILVGGLLLENRGRVTAPNVQVNIKYGQDDSARIRHMRISSEEAYVVRGGGDQHNFATIRLRQLGPGKKLVVYWAAAQELQPSVSVTNFQTRV